MHERDTELMTAEIDRSRETKIALKKTIQKKNRRLQHCERTIQDLSQEIWILKRALDRACGA